MSARRFRRALAAAAAGLLLTACGAMVQAQQPSAPAPSPVKAEPVRGPHGSTRIDFDERLVQGQTKKAEALYLFERRNSEIKSLVQRRRSFRQEIIRKLDE